MNRWKVPNTHFFIKDICLDPFLRSLLLYLGMDCNFSEGIGTTVGLFSFKNNNSLTLCSFIKFFFSVFMILLLMQLITFFSVYYNGDMSGVFSRRWSLTLHSSSIFNSNDKKFKTKLKPATEDSCYCWGTCFFGVDRTYVAGIRVKYITNRYFVFSYFFFISWKSILSSFFIIDIK